MGEQNTCAVVLRGLRKTFGEVLAVDHADLDLRCGEILALLGENGSGKTTLMNMLSGIYYPDGGKITLFGQDVSIRNPAQAYELKIGMVHQHFKLVDRMSAAENIVLGLPADKSKKRGQLLNEIRSISERFGFQMDPEKKIYNMSVSEKQTVEIVKVLYRGADILILDEPTAVLTPQEIEKFFAILRAMRDAGKAILLITHKMHEIMGVSDRVTVMRKGRVISTVNTAEADVKSLTEMMVGRQVKLDIDRPQVAEKERRLLVKDLTSVAEDGCKRLDQVSFTAYGGEILGVAGIAGSGQRELCDAIYGLLAGQSGSIIYYKGSDSGKGSDNGKDSDNGAESGYNLSKMNCRTMIKEGIQIAYVPEDRLGMGLLSDGNIIDNIMLKTYQKGKSPFLDRLTPKKQAAKLVDDLHIVTAGLSTPIRRLSGGNIQKVLLGREISSAPRLLLVAYPVRGLDIHSSNEIYALLNEQKQNGVAVIFIGEDLDVLMEISDRILVLCQGKVSGIVDPRICNKEKIGLLMMGHTMEEGALSRERSDR